MRPMTSVDPPAADARPNWREKGRPLRSNPASCTSGKQYIWKIYHIKGTPAVLLDHGEAADQETAIKKAI
jgi:hypothetical protein